MGRLSGRRRARFGDLPLSWKLLLPSIGLIVILGIVGGYLIVRDLSARSQAALDLELSRRVLDTRSALRDGELSLIESVNFASNLEGAATAIQSRDVQSLTRLLESVIALKTDLQLLSATDLSGRSIIEFARPEPGTRPQPSNVRAMWPDVFVREALADQNGRKHAGIASLGERTLLAMAAPICSGRTTCRPAGAAIVGIDLDRIASDALTRSASAQPSRSGLTIFDPSGRIAARAGALAPSRIVRTSGSRGIHGSVGSVPVATLFGPFELTDGRVGTLGVSVPADTTLASVRRTGFGLGLMLLAAMAGIALLGVLLSRLTVRRMRSLIATNRALGRGDLRARARVDWNDEIGELGTRLNEMAEQLEAMYETLELRVAQRTEEVERLLQERTEFFASVSHELRTPLAVILRHAEMLLDDAYGKGGRWKLEAGTALKDSGGQLAQLIDDILQLAEVEAGGLLVDLETVDLGARLREFRATIEPLARASGVRARVRPLGKTLVLADPRRLRQIVLNLADNAVKYTPEGGNVDVWAEADGDVVRVSVADTGVGVPAEAGERIFDPFYRARGTKTQQGQSSSGLGLAVARRLVEAHGGTITYTSKPEGGTVFTFTLPRADRSAPLAVSANGSENDD